LIKQKRLNDESHADKGFRTSAAKVEQLYNTDTMKTKQLADEELLTNSERKATKNSAQALHLTVRCTFFDQRFTLEDAIEFLAFAQLEALACV
jgi:hypothetical protein